MLEACLNCLFYSLLEAQDESGLPKQQLPPEKNQAINFLLSPYSYSEKGINDKASQRIPRTQGDYKHDHNPNP
jgi:hypothetical protein